MKFKLLYLGIIASFFNSSCIAQTTSMYVGTYTNGDSEGIYKLQFNTKTGELSDKVLAVATKNPSFITFSPNKKCIYAVGEGESSNVTAFQLNSDGTLKFLNTESSNGKNPCHVALNEKGNKAVVSNYSGGTVSVYDINDQGHLSKASQVFDHNSENEKSHAHSAQFFKDDLFVADLGRNGLYQYIQKDGNYKLKTEAVIETTGNPGPRHFVLTKNGNFIYVINEYGASITSIKRTENGFKKIDEDGTLDPSFKEYNKCADIHLSKDERFIYGSNRGENTIAVFKRDTNTGELNRIQNISVHGNWPRNFTLDLSGNFLLVANQKSENISVFRIDKSSGKLSFLHDQKVPSPVCLIFQ